MGTDDGLVQISEDGGEQLVRQAERFPGLPANSYVTDRVRISEGRQTCVFVDVQQPWQSAETSSRTCVKSEDRGRSWTVNITGNLPERSGTWSIVQDHVNPDLLFAGLEFGVFVTVDGGSHWTQLQGGIPTAQARDLHIQQRENDLVVGTFGRGAYILDDYTALRSLTTRVLAEEAWLFPARPAYLYGERSYVRAAWGNVATPNPPFGAVLTYHVAAPATGDESLVLTITDADGDRVREISLGDETGLQRVTWDLRSDPPPPPAEGTGQGRRARQGPLVEAGRYTATLGLRNGDSVTAFGVAQTVQVVRITPEL